MIMGVEGIYTYYLIPLAMYCIHLHELQAMLRALNCMTLFYIPVLHWQLMNNNDARI